jgi:hypothetical protein
MITNHNVSVEMGHSRFWIIWCLARVANWPGVRRVSELLKSRFSPHYLRQAIGKSGEKRDFYRSFSPCDERID